MSEQLKSATWMKWFTVAAVLVMLALGAGQRIVPANQIVFGSEDRVNLLGVDAYFHLRHAERLANNYPALRRVDTGSNYPDFHTDDATGLLALTVATVAKITSGEEVDTNEVAFILAWMPVLIGLTTMFLLFLTGRVIGGNSLGLIVMLLHLLQPSTSLNRSVVGFSDHHILEVMMVIWMLYGLISLIRRSSDDSAITSWRPSFLLGGASYMFFFAWVGAPMYTVVFSFITVVYMGMLIAKGRSLHGFAQASFSFHSAGLIGFVLAVFLWPDLIVAQADPVQVGVVLMLTGLAVGPYILSLIVEKFRAKKMNNVAVAAVFLSLMMLAIWFVFTQIEVGRWAALVLFRARTILVREQVDMDFANSLKHVVGLGYLTLLSLPIILYDVWTSKKREPMLFALLLGIGVFALWMQTNDYDYMPGAILAISAGYGVHRLGQWLLTLNFSGFTSKKKAPGKSKRGASTGSVKAVDSSRTFSVLNIGVASIVVAILVVGPIWPLGMKAPMFKMSQARSLAVYSEGIMEAAVWMSENTQEPVLDEVEKADYGVYTVWDFGNIIASYGHRSPLYSRYPRDMESGFLIARTEDEAIDKLCPRCTPGDSVRYVLADARSAGEFFAAKAMMGGITLKINAAEPFPKQEGVPNIPHATYGADFDSSMINNLYMRSGMGLEHFRLLWESEEKSFVAYRGIFTPKPGGGSQADVKRVSIPLDKWTDQEQYKNAAKSMIIKIGDSFMYDAEIEPTAKVFEYVKGASFRGKIPSGTALEVGLILTSSRMERRMRYRRILTPDENGNVEFTVPYSHESDSTRTVEPESPYLLSLMQDGERLTRSTQALELDEQDVLKGAEFEFDVVSNKLRVRKITPSTDE